MEMTCPDCEGDGCDPCRRKGKVKIIACPRAAVADVAPLLRAYQILRKHGILPVGGGWLDQTQQFLNAVALIDTEITTSGGR